MLKPSLTITSFYTPERFDRDLLRTLKIFSETVNEVLPKSAIKMALANEPEWKWQTLNKIINGHIRGKSDKGLYHNDIKNLTNAVQGGVGECFENAVTCKILLDLYLEETLTQLGYVGVEISSDVVEAVKPSDHTVVLLTCCFKYKYVYYVLDPWLDGQAWLKNDALEYYNKNVDGIWIRENFALNFNSPRSAFRAPYFKENMKNCFSAYGVVRRLQANLRKLRCV